MKNDGNVKVITNRDGSFNAEIDYQGLQNDVRKEIEQLLESRGAKVLNNGYSGGQKVSEIINKFDKTRYIHDQAVAEIRKTYREDVAASKIGILDTDYRLDKEGFIHDLDEIIADDKKYREKRLEALQNTKEYREAKIEVLRVLSLFKGLELPSDALLGIANPMIEAMDSKSLELCKLLVGEASINAKILEQVQDEIHSYTENADLQRYVTYTKDYINSDGSDASLSVDMYRSYFSKSKK